MGNITAFEQKMTAAGMGDAAIRAFRRNYEALLRHETGLIFEDSIAPAGGFASLADIAGGTPAEPALLAQAMVIKLNGGLGTGMGLQAPKSLLAVREGVNFLDLMVRQILDLRQSSGAPVRLLLMNSFSTSAETLAYLQHYRAAGLAEAAEVELMQNQIPKIDAATLRPVVWPADPDLEWCPPGHGDLYPALVGSGWLDRLLGEGVRYAFVSNSDNLGAVLDPVILRYFAASGAPFLMEVTRRTAADRKGGHLARRKEDGRLLLREVAQCPEADRAAFQDIERHRYFNTNSLWFRATKNRPLSFSWRVPWGRPSSVLKGLRPLRCHAAVSRRSRPRVTCWPCVRMLMRCLPMARCAYMPRVMGNLPSFCWRTPISWSMRSQLSACRVSLAAVRSP